MRLFTLLAFSISALALAACSMMPGQSKPATTAAAEKTAPASADASAQEEKEMAAVMGGTAAPVDNVDVAEVPVTDMEPPQDIEAAPEMSNDDMTKGGKPIPVTGTPDECPTVQVLPDTKSITYFDDPEGKPTGALVARATLVDIKGGCDYTDDGVIVDIDLIMQGKITDKGRYEGRKDLEAFMTFPYFVAVMDPDGKMVDKKIMATAMRFKPQEDDLDHAEKITQTIPLADISHGADYTITVGFQLNRAQLDYNRGTVSEDAPKAGTKSESKPEDKPDAKAEAGDKAEMKMEESVSPSAAAAETPETSKETPSMSATAPAAGGSAPAKMQPIVD
jgi:hypothetical protein